MMIYLKSLGCRLNEAELEDWADDFQASGHVVTSNAEQADLVVINTCAVTQEAVKKSRQLIRKTHRHNPRAKLVVSGCYASLAPEIQREISGIDLLVANRDKDKLPEIVNERLMPETMPSSATLPGTAALYQRGRNRAFIKVQDGCRYRCTFCIVTVARGKERSRQAGDIIEQINQLSKQGIKEIVLTGVHVGGYGSDINSDLYGLVQSILEHTDMPRIRLASVEPWDLPDEFFMLFNNKRLLPHMHLPLQSGSDVILKAMARRCKTADYAKLINKARAEVADFNVTTDIIVGFPGETDDEWQRSLEYIEAIGFSHVHIFPYSARAGTRAASLPDHVPVEIKKDRCRQLQALSIKMKRQCLQRQLGRRASVLIEEIKQPGQTAGLVGSGYTPDYHRVQVQLPEDKNIQNQIKDVMVLALNKTEDCLLAELH